MSAKASTASRCGPTSPVDRPRFHTQTMLTVIEGNGAGARPVNRHKKILETAHRIEHHVLAGHFSVGQTLARALTPIERALVTERMFRNGFGEDVVVRVLAP